MFRKIVVGVMLLALVHLTCGCVQTLKVPPEKMRKTEQGIIKLVMLDGRVVEFAPPGASYDPKSNTIIGFSEYKPKTSREGGIAGSAGEAMSIPADSVMTVWVKRVDAAATVAIVALSIVALVVIIVAISDQEDEPPPPPSDGTQSCPFIYSYDGSQYTFDAEPLGGAICQALERTDYSRLEYLKPVDDKYHINVKNVMPETQYLDQVQILAVDHAVGQKVVPDTAGRMHLVTSLRTPVRAFDEAGRDMLPFISADDGLSWQTVMTPAGLEGTSDTRHHVTLEFDKPTDAKTAYLVANTGTALWGSRMMREMLQARGSAVTDWYESVNARGPEFLKLLRFTFNEELYLMKVNVQKEDQLVQRSLIFGGGPFVSEDRLISFDVSDIPGDKLTINLNPPKGFWTLDYFAIQYDSDSILPTQACQLETATNQDMAGIENQLMARDGNYYTMAQIGDWSELTFSVPPQPDLTERSLFLKTTGYYVLHTDTTAVEQRALIDSVMRTPGAITDYSTQLYLDNYHKLLSAATR